MDTTTTLQFGFDTRNIVNILAGEYPTLKDIIREGAQNGIDAGATRLMIVLNHKDRRVDVMDNGKGASFEEIRAKFLQIGKTNKSGNVYGMFGVGLLSPIGKCKKVFFTSRTKGDHAFYDLVIDEKELQKSMGVPQIAVRPSTADAGKEWWTTRVTMLGIKEDHYTCRFPTPQEIESEIISNFNVGLERNKTDVVIIVISEHGIAEKAYTFKARPYGGEPLPETEISDDSKRGGKALFRLFVVRSRRGGRGVSVGNRVNPSRIRWTDFVRHMSQEQLSSDLSKALSKESGFFEGEILTSALAFLNVDRQTFKMSDQLLEFLVAIEKWWQTIGKEIYEEAIEEGRDQVYQVSMLNVLRDVQNTILKDDETRKALYQELSAMMRTGTVGDSHARVPRKNLVGDQPDKSLATLGGPIKPKSNTYQGHEISDRPKAKQGDVTTSALGPMGRKRRIVKDDGTGLQMEVATMAGSSLAYEFIPEMALIRINSRHPDFARCEDKSDRVLTQYMALIAQDVILKIITRSLEDDKTNRMLDMKRAMAVRSLTMSPLFNQGALLSQAREEREKKEKK
ncbi:ATP-binding protein [Patescibacteria group bacterium]|nr:ATP-binding protein [Patescibacteria group bacterium]